MIGAKLTTAKSTGVVAVCGVPPLFAAATIGNEEATGGDPTRLCGCVGSMMYRSEDLGRVVVRLYAYNLLTN